MAGVAFGSGNLDFALQDAPHSFLQPELPLYTDTLTYLKHALDPLALDISKVQSERLRDARKKRRRGEIIDQDDVLRLKQVHTAGFSVEQIWEQVRRVIEAANAEAERGVNTAEKDVVNGSQDVDEDEPSHVSDDEDLGEEGVDFEVGGPDVDGEDWDDEDESEGADIDNNGHDDFDSMDLDDIDDEEIIGNDEPPDEFVADKFGLNDGFFSIDDFNRKSEFLEQQDARGEDDGAASDEEDIDYEADPLAKGAATLDDDMDGMDDGDDDDDGPTFGDPDAMSEDDDNELDGGDLDAMGRMSNTNHIMYTDFFAPPAQKKRKNKKGRPNPHNFPSEQLNDKEMAGDEDMERTMAAVHRDLFQDDESEQDEDEDMEPLDPSDPKSRKSTHERRKAALAEEIRKLEAANVAKREWTLSGEARAADRPMNSLLEEDLDFERAGKPVPVITAEVSESIEDLIKRRILAHDFQDIIRRRPDDLATGKNARRGRLDFELDDNKSKKGLAEEYEEEHLRKTDPNFVEVKDEKTKKEEKEIETLWKKVSAELDSLSSWNFRPKQPVPQLDIRVDAPAIGMEDARPSAGGEVAGASQLAPQEVYKGGEAGKGVREEVVGKNGLPAGREEMSREEKKRRRRREKERIKKAGSNDAREGNKNSDKARTMMGDLKRGGVKVIGKKGDVKDVEGREITTGSNGPQSAGRYKL